MLLYKKLMFPIILPGSGRGVLPFAISPVVSTDSINCEPGIIIFCFFFPFKNVNIVHMSIPNHDLM